MFHLSHGNAFHALYFMESQMDRRKNGGRLVEMKSEDCGHLGLFSCTAMLVGAMIGSAIFSLSGLTMMGAGPASVVSWLCAGVLMLAYGLFMGELACAFPQSGGVYVFPRMAFEGVLGQWLGWLACWSAILTNIVAVAFGAIYVGTYLSVAFPWAARLQVPLALASILLCFLLNVIKFSTAGKINAVIVCALLGTMAVYVSMAFFGGHYEAGRLLPFFTQGTNGALGVVSAIPVALIGYSGVISMAFMVGEVRNPRVTVPLSMVLSIGAVSVVYALMILATMGVISAGYLVENEEMRFIPLFAACFTGLADTPWLASVVSLSAVLALLTTMLVCISMNARAIQAAGNDGALPLFLGGRNASGAPAAASIATCLAAAACACFPQMTMQIVNFGALFNVVTIFVTSAALVQARRRNLCGHSFKAPGGPLLPWGVMAALALCYVPGIVAGGTGLWCYTAVFLALGAVLRLFVQRVRKGREPSSL